MGACAPAKAQHQPSTVYCWLYPESGGSYDPTRWSGSVVANGAQEIAHFDALDGNNDGQINFFDFSAKVVAASGDVGADDGRSHELFA